MFGSALSWERSARGVCSVAACLCLISSCSLRDTDSLESGPAASGRGSSGDGSAGNAGESAGGKPGAGANQGGEANGGAAAGEAGESGAAGQSGSESGGTGGGEPPLLGAFENCPARKLWNVESSPTDAEVSAKAAMLMIMLDQMQPKYAIDDTDTTGEATRYSTGRGMRGDELVTIDMGVEKWVSGVYTKEPSPNDYGREYEVSVSTDNASFTPVVTVEGKPGIVTVLFDPVVARYVRLAQKGAAESFWWSLHDYRVYCTPEAVPAGGSGGTGGTGGTSGSGGKGGTAGN